MTEKKVFTINKYDERLVGIKTTPETKKTKFAVVILIQGFGIEKEEGGMFTELASLLGNKGIIVYRFDISGCYESEGNFSETTLSKQKDDLSVIISYIKSQDDTDSSRIGILGQSFGTITTVSLEPDIKCIVMMGSVSHPHKIISRIFGSGYSPDGISRIKKASGRVIEINKGFWTDLDSYNLLSSMKNITSPILFIHGGDDNIVPLSEMEAYYDNANEPKEKFIIKGANHGLMPYRKEMYSKVLDWFDINL